MQDGWLCYQKYLLSNKSKKQKAKKNIKIMCEINIAYKKTPAHPFNIKSHKLNIT